MIGELDSIDRPAPVGVFAYNRPAHLRAVLEALGRCDGYHKHDLRIYCDGSRAEEDHVAVRQTRDVAHNWCREHSGTVVERPQNFRFRNITDGVSELCHEYGRVIVVEDDILVAPDFLRYMNEALDRYESDDRVYHVGGYMPPVRHPEQPQVFFSPYPPIWGWATWERAWKAYDPHPSGWRTLLRDASARQRFDLHGAFRFSEMLEDCMAGKLDTWDIQWSFAVFAANGLALLPRRSLVFNIGFDGTGIHCGSGGSHLVNTDSLDDYKRPRLSWPVGFPPRMAVDADAYRRMVGDLKGRSSLLSRVKFKLRSLGPRK